MRWGKDKLLPSPPFFYERGRWKGNRLAENPVDRLHKAIRLLRERPTILKRYQDRYKMVLVDEFQDNNYAQLELLKLLCPSGNLFVVGDDDQSIYRFRGAYLTNVQDFQKHWRDYDLQKLEKNGQY